MLVAESHNYNHWRNILLVILSENHDGFALFRLIFLFLEEAEFELERLRGGVLLLNHHYVEIGILLVVDAEVGVHVDLLTRRARLSVAALRASARASRVATVSARGAALA